MEEEFNQSQNQPPEQPSRPIYCWNYGAQSAYDNGRKPKSIAAH